MRLLAAQFEHIGVPPSHFNQCQRMCVKMVIATLQTLIFLRRQNVQAVVTCFFAPDVAELTMTLRYLDIDSVQNQKIEVRQRRERILS